VWTTYLNTNMCKFESSQKYESRVQSADSWKAYIKPRVFNCRGLLFLKLWSLVHHRNSRDPGAKLLKMPVFNLLLLWTEQAILTVRGSMISVQWCILSVLLVAGFYQPLPERMRGEGSDKRKGARNGSRFENAHDRRRLRDQYKAVELPGWAKLHRDRSVHKIAL